MSNSQSRPLSVSVDARFAAGVKLARETQGMTQDALAKAMTEVHGYRWHQATVYKVELGERKVTVGEALALEDLLNTDIDTMASANHNSAASLGRAAWNAAYALASAILDLDESAEQVSRHRALLEAGVRRYGRYVEGEIPDDYAPLLRFHLADELIARLRSEVFASQDFQRLMGELTGVVGLPPRGGEEKQYG